MPQLEVQNELNEEFCEVLQKLIDIVDKNDYIILTGDMNARVENSSVENVRGTKHIK